METTEEHPTDEDVEKTTKERGMRLPAEVYIEEEEMAKRTATLNDETEALAVYTDGSRLESGGVGAGYMWLDEAKGEWEGQSLCMGSKKEVFDAELYGIRKALERLVDRTYWIETRHGARIRIFSDSTAALKRIKTDAVGPGQEQARKIIEWTKTLARWGISVEFHWVPGHEGVPGNEAADTAAKNGAEGMGHVHEEEWQNEISLAHLNRKTTEWKWNLHRAWLRRRCRGRRSYTLPKERKPDPRAATAAKSVARRYYQMKTGHAIMATYFKRFKSRDSEECGWCGAKRQTRDHLFRWCKRWKREITELWETVKEETKGKRTRHSSTMTGLLGDKKCIPAVLQFLEATDVGKRCEGGGKVTTADAYRRWEEAAEWMEAED
jgi:ribonuclease HI